MTEIRPLNCRSELGKLGGARCPHCGLWHLRAGYCWALDPDTPENPVLRRLQEKYATDIPGAADVTLRTGETDESVTLRQDVTLREAESVTLSPDVTVNVTLREEGVTLTNCATCGKPMEVKRMTKGPRYCSGACRIKAHRKKS